MQFTKPTEKSQELFKRAKRVIPGGVNSPVRAFKGVGGNPLFIKKGKGAHITDLDDNIYIDYVNSWGPLILGHAIPEVLIAIEESMQKGTSFGAPTEKELELAELITSIVPGVEMVRMVNSGTEATMSAIRLARGYTNRDYIIKFNGCYHGHSDSLLVSAGSGVATFGIAGSPGIPKAISELSLSIEYNDANLLEQTIKTVGAEKVAAVIVEPVAGNMGLVLPGPGYLQTLRDICTRYGIILIFDEVMTGFRIALGGASERFGILADLYTFGKVIGGGLPVGVLAGKREIMSKLSPEGSIYQAGTLSGNPLAMSAGCATVKYLQRNNPYPLLEEQGKLWVKGMKEAAKEAGVSLQANSCGSMIGYFFSEIAVSNYAEVKNTDLEKFNRFFWGMLEAGIYLAPSAYEAGFISIAHTNELIDQTIMSARKVMKSLF